MKPEAILYGFMGHSLGGLVAAKLSVADDMKDKIAGLILVEPTHPQELLASPPQRLGARNIHSTMILAPNSIRCGLGWLTNSSQNISSNVPVKLAKSLKVELQTVKIWSGAAREWKFIYPALLDGTFAVPKPDVPTLLIVGDDTEFSADDQKTLYDDYVESDRSITAYIEGASHLGLMMDEDSSKLTAKEIINFVQKNETL